MDNSTPSGCYKPPENPPLPPVADGAGEPPERELLVPLLMRVRFAIVCSWLPREATS